MRSLPPRVLVHEYVTGGGWPAEDLPHGLAAEGFTMLRAVLNDFRLWGGVSLITTRDVRLAGFSLCADRVVNLHREEYLRTLNDLVADVDAVLVIAPESNGVLARLSALVEERGRLLLGSSAEGVSVAGDKWDCFRRFSENNLPTPRTWRLSCAEALTAAEEIGFPLVVKPIDGVGCEGVSIASDSSSLRMALDLLHPWPESILLQPYLSGTHASVSLLVSETGVLPLSLNEQVLSVGVPFLYRGGTVPLDHMQRDSAFEYAERAVSLAPGLRGYVGVDMLLTERESYTIEINPRLTTSYVGLRQVIDINLAEAIWRACCDCVLPQKIILSGTASFDNNEEFGADGLA
ncbi:MAG: ATP-grasp domain-containing protein [Syntrophobacteraceae bacterium]